MVVDGVARFVAGAGTAEELLVVVGGHTLVAVPARAPGVERSAVPTVDRSMVHVALHGVSVEPVQVVGEPGSAGRWLPRGGRCWPPRWWARRRRHWTMRRSGPATAGSSVRRWDRSRPSSTAWPMPLWTWSPPGDAAGALDRGDGEACLLAAEAKLLCAEIAETLLGGPGLAPRR